MDSPTGKLLFGIFLPGIVFLISFLVTWRLYKKFSAKE